MISRLEKKFDLYWRGLGGPQLVAEHRFCPPRKWRFDFAHPETKTAIEIEGGHWTGGRHTRGQGFSADCVKYLEANLAGWTVFRLTGDQIRVPTLERIIKHVLQQSEDANLISDPGRGKAG